jgi:hypothetical protein
MSFKSAASSSFIAAEDDYLNAPPPSNKYTIRLVKKIHASVNSCSDRLSMSAHTTAVCCLSKLCHAMMQDGQELPPQSNMSLLCTGISLFRQHSVKPADDEIGILLKRTATLVFVVLAMSCTLERKAKPIQSTASAETTLRTVREMSIWDSLQCPSTLSDDDDDERVIGGTSSGCVDKDCQRLPKRMRGEPVVMAEAGTTTAKTTTTICDAEISRSALFVARGKLSSNSMAEFETLAGIFFRSSTSQMAAQLLMADATDDFCALSSSQVTRGLEDEREERLLAIVQSGESEAGQQVMRDTMLSLLMPYGEIGVRRVLLLSREASTLAGVNHPGLVQRAHEVAMAGPEWIWRNATEEVERMCALLAGVAVLTTKGGDDPIRKADAFGGRVQLPFLETNAPVASALRVMFIRKTQKWVLYQLNAGDGMPVIQSCQKGFVGLCNTLLLFLK